MNDNDTKILTEAYETIQDVFAKTEMIEYLKENKLYKKDYDNYTAQQLFELFQTDDALIGLNEWRRKRTLRYGRGLGRGLGFGRGLGRGLKSRRYYRDKTGPHGRGMGPGRGLASCRKSLRDDDEEK